MFFARLLYFIFISLLFFHLRGKEEDVGQVGWIQRMFPT